MNQNNFLVSTCIFLLLTMSAFSQNGKNLFNANCVACHTIGKGQLVGPDLKGEAHKRAEDWLLKWIKSSQTMVKDKDPQAVAIYNQFNQIVMPDQPFSEDQIKALLDYINTGNSGNYIASNKNVAANKSEKDTSSNAVMPVNNNTTDKAKSKLDNNSSATSNSINSKLENPPSDQKAANTTSVIVPEKEGKTDDVKSSNPDHLFVYSGIGIMMLFFLGILYTMVLVIKVLTKALEKKYDKEFTDK